MLGDIRKVEHIYIILNALEKWKLCKGVQIENVDFDIPPEQRNCSNCGMQMKLLGKNMVREVPEFIPAKLKLNRYWQYTYYCPCCKKAGRLATKAIPTPKPLLNHSMASPSVVEEVIYQKYVNHVPLVPTGAGVERPECSIQSHDHGKLDDPLC